MTKKRVEEIKVQTDQFYCSNWFGTDEELKPWSTKLNPADTQSGARLETPQKQKWGDKEIDNQVGRGRKYNIFPPALRQLGEPTIEDEQDLAGIPNDWNRSFNRGGEAGRPLPVKTVSH